MLDKGILKKYFTFEARSHVSSVRTGHRHVGLSAMQSSGGNKLVIEETCKYAPFGKKGSNRVMGTFWV